MHYTDEQLEVLWDDLTDVSFDVPEDTGFDDLTLAQEWQGFPLGTRREDIWHWFDARHSRGVAWLLLHRRGSLRTKNL